MDQLKENGPTWCSQYQAEPDPQPVSKVLLRASSILPQKGGQNEIRFDRNGWPVNPATGQAYSRDEIVTDPAIPYPKHVDPHKPDAYWRRRTPAQLQTEKQRIEKKRKRRRRQLGIGSSKAGRVKTFADEMRESLRQLGYSVRDTIERVP